MPYQNYLIEALDVVLSWDMPEESVAEAVKIQANVMARIDFEESLGPCSD